MDRKYHLTALGYDLDKIIERVSQLFDMEPHEILQTGKQPLRVLAPSLVFYWTISELGISATEVVRRIGLSQSALSRAELCGKKVADEQQYSIETENE